MANYSTLLKTWGDTGSEYPDGYSYLEGEQPVDAWDNFLISNVISDLDSLISTTNDRIETDKGGSGGEPASPETAHLYHDSGNEALEFWDSTQSTWRRLLAADGDTMAGSLDMAGYALTGAGDITDDNGNTVFDYTAGHVPESIVQQGSGSGLDADTVDGTEAANLGSGASDSGTSVVSPATDFNFAQNLSVSDDGDGTVTVDAANQPDSHTAVSEDGTEMYGSVDDINFQGFLNLVDDGDGTVSLDPTHNHDSRYYTESELDTKLGNKSDTGHLHDSRYYTQSEADSNFDNFDSFTVTEGNGSETSTIGSGGNIEIYGGTDIQTEMDGSDNLQVSMTGNYDNYGSWTIEEGDGEQTNINSGQKLEIYGGNDINTEITSTGGESRLRVAHDNTTSQGDVTTGGATVIDDIYIDGNGHVTNLNTQNRSLDDWNAPSSTVYFDRDGIQSQDSWLEIDGSGSGLLLNYKNQGEETRVYGTLDVRGGLTGVSLGDLSDVSASGEGSGNNFDADTVDGEHASDLGAPSSTQGVSTGSQTISVSKSDGDDQNQSGTADTVVTGFSTSATSADYTGLDYKIVLKMPGGNTAYSNTFSISRDTSHTKSINLPPGIPVSTFEIQNAAYVAVDLTIDTADTHLHSHSI